MDCIGNISGTLRAQEHGHQPIVFDVHGQNSRFKETAVTSSREMDGNDMPLILPSKHQLYENHGIDARYTGSHAACPMITARAGTGGGNLPLVTDDPCYCITGNAINRQPQNGGNGIGYQENTTYTLTVTDRHAIYSRQRVDVFKKDDIASTESARQHKDATDLIYQKTVEVLSNGDRKKRDSQYEEQDNERMDSPLLIRRLTPLECERLQGYPDHWTDLPGASDSARYKALGNSVAIPCVEYVMQGIAMVLAADFSMDGRNS